MQTFRYVGVMAQGELLRVLGGDGAEDVVAARAGTESKSSHEDCKSSSAGMHSGKLWWLSVVC